MVCDRFPHSNCRALAKAPSLEQAEPTCRKMPYLLRPRSSKESTTCRCSTVASCHIFVASPMVHGWNYQTSLAFTLHKFKFKNGSEFNSHPSPIQLRLWLLAELFGCWHLLGFLRWGQCLLPQGARPVAFPNVAVETKKEWAAFIQNIDYLWWFAETDSTTVLKWNFRNAWTCEQLPQPILHQAQSLARHLGCMPQEHLRTYWMI